MQIDVIEGYEALAVLERNWNAVYDADPEAQFFLSWTWIAKFIETENGQFLTLAAKLDADAPDYVAFFPIGLGTTALDKGGFVTEVHMAAAGASDYAGFICRPEFDATAIPAFAKTIASMRWATMHIEDFLASDRRFELFFRGFPKTAFKTARADKTNPIDGIDTSVAPRVQLPDTWQAYLETKLTSNTRQKMRRFLNKIESDEAYRITHATAETIDGDIAVLLEFWTAQWQSRKGRRTAFMVAFFNKMLGHCFRNDVLYLPVLWHDDKPIAALGIIVDAKANSLLFYIGGRDDTHKGPPAGFVLHAHTIRYAIANGFASYDLLQGNGPYKYSFGAEDRELRNITVSTKNVGALTKCLDPRCLARAIDITRRLHKAGRLAEAERGYRQILALDPRHATAVQGYGSLLAQRGNRAAADKLIKSFQAQRD